MAICDATHRCKLAESLAQILLSVRIMARHLLGFAPFRFVIRLPMKFSRYSISAFSGACDIWLWISRERLPSGDKNLSSRMHEWPVAEAWKGGTRSCTGCYGFLGCFVYLEVKNLGNQLGSHPAYLFFIEAKVRNTVFVIQGSGCQSRNITLIVLQHSIDRVHIAGRCRFDVLAPGAHSQFGSGKTANLPRRVPCGFHFVKKRVQCLHQKEHNRI